MRFRSATIPSVLVAVLCALTVACVPSDTEGATELDDGSGFAPPGRTAPVFPPTGLVPADLLVAGIVYDMTEAPVDRNVWVPDEPSATCAARGIVDGLGAARLSELGYRPGTDGNGLVQVALTTAERELVADRVAGCVDLRDAVGTLLMGDDQMSGDDAACIADGLEQRGLLARFASAFAFGENVDPLSGDGALADALLTSAQVCVGSDAFDWLDSELPGSDDGTAPAPTTTVPGTPDGLANRTGSAGTTP